MTLIKQTPDQPFIETDGTWDWENEETLVDRRNKLPYRIQRFISRWWLITLFIVLIAAAMLSADIAREVVIAGESMMGLMESAMQPPNLGDSGILRVITLLLQFAIIALAFIFQFVIFFWLGSKTRMYTIWPGQEGVGFADYRGQPELLDQARQIVLLLRGVKAFEGAGGEPLNGLLLEGPPGTGKTWLAQAISTEAGVPFFFVDASSLQGTFLGMGAIKVSRMYGKARKAAKEYGAAVVFLDEIDSIGSRGAVSMVGQDDSDGSGTSNGMGMGSSGLLSTMLIEMSGFSLEHGWRARLKTWWYKKILGRKPPKPQKRVLTIGATNMISALDPALLRPGRFDKKIHVDAPDMEGRRDIIEYYLSKMAHDESMQPAVLSTETPGYTPADIKYLLNEALRYALFSGRRYITYRDWSLAQPEHEMGMRSPLKHMSKEERERLAYHEAGHALAVRLFMPEHRIARITIVRQGAAFGHVKHYPAREAYQGMHTKDKLMNRLKVSVAGKAAEIEFSGLQNQTLGVGGDFRVIRYWLRLMAGAGMFGTLGGSMGNREDMLNGGSMDSPTPEMARAMEEVFLQVLVETRQTLRENAHIMNALVSLLLEKQELLADEVKAFFDLYSLHTPDPSMIKDGEEIILFPEGKPVPELPA